MNGNLFSYIEAIVNYVFSFIENAATTDMMNALYLLFAMTITLTILFKGYMVLAGKSREPILELAWDITIKTIIVLFALNIDGWLDLVINAMNGMHEWAGGGISIFAKLDELTKSTIDLANAVESKGNMVSGFFYSLIVWGGSMLCAWAIVWVAITVSVTLKLIILIAPFVIFFTIYSPLKNMFTQWLSIFFGNVYTVLLITLIVNAVIETYQKLQDKLITQVTTDDPLWISMQILIIGILMSGVIRVVVNFAQQLATVSMEGVMTSELGKSLNTTGKYSKKVGQESSKQTFNVGRLLYKKMKG